MKNQTQIGRKNNRYSTIRQVGGLAGGSREILISSRCKESLDVLAARFKIDPLKIAAGAIRNYLSFVEQNPSFAQAQPTFCDCDALLGFFDPKQRILAKLDLVCETYNLLPAQVISSAIKVYSEYAERQKGELRQLVEKYPGEIDPEQIAFLLSEVTRPVIDLLDETVANFRQLPFEKALNRMKALLGLMTHHPRLEKQRIALQMIVEGANQLT